MDISKNITLDSSLSKLADEEMEIKTRGRKMM